jgi:ATP-dependent Lon protease
LRFCSGAGNKMRSPILCFVGPPGTGKTSLGRSIADALGRKFIRVSLGGIRDEAEIRGHRRTYIGALPGRIIQSMRRAGSINPIFMLDEIDKVGADFRGDPSAALLEALDPEQNNSFSDHYLELPYDLSKVMFITTANVLHTIPPALRDRMEVIEFSGYVEEEKLAIARQFLIPRQLEEHGLEDQPLRFTDSAVRGVVREYTYEAGVRNLEREIGHICRKLTRALAEGRNVPSVIVRQGLPRFLGPPQYTEQALSEADEVGIATGIAYTDAGGDIMPIEVAVMPGKGHLTLTGQLGDVMQESVQAALSYTKANAKTYKIDPEDFDNHDIHLHVPEGAIPKDGPSAGITMATALISAFSGYKVHRDVAMTGEITLRGKVLPIGGLKEKILAAHRAGIKTVVVPAKNKKDLVDVPKKIQRDLDLVLADTMDTVLDVALIIPPRKRKTKKKINSS